MVYLTVEGLSKSVPDKVLFEDLKFSLHKGDKVGFIANNGTGKTSLLEVLTGKDEPDDGTIYIKDGIRVGYLEQEPSFNEELTIAELLESDHTDIQVVIKEYNQILTEQELEYSEAGARKLEEISHKMDQLNAWDYKRKVDEMISRFGITNLKLPIGTLSGGEKKRLAMAFLLIDSPEILILDEPTNHLDVELIEWLEKYLSQSYVTLLMVTHDRYFLDNVCNRILELENGKLYHHKGNYGTFLENRSQREDAFASEVGKAKKLFKKELDWIRRSPMARTTKAKSRITSFGKIKEKAHSKTSKDELKLEIQMSRVGGKILELKKIRKSYDEKKIIDGFSHTFRKGERIGIVGKNGVGKSTFLKIILGKEDTDSGKINIGDNTVFGYYSQVGLKLKTDQRVIDVIKDIAEVITLANGAKVTASEFLKHFLFPVPLQRTFYSKLSGGEKRRLYLLTVLIKNPNFLILDEPTNDLDLLTLNKLEEFLENYSGCLILVSHDRYFMDKLVDQLFIFQGDGQIKGYVGTYYEYRELKKSIDLNSSSNEVKQNQKSKTKNQKSQSGRLGFNEKREYNQLEKDIAKLEKEKLELELKMDEVSTDYEELSKVSSRLGEVIELIDDKTFRWMELDEQRNDF